MTAAASAITHRRVLAIAVPIVLSNATIPILGAVDTAVVGQLGQAAPIGAVGLGAVILASIYWVFGFLRMGTTGMVAQARGAGETAETGALLMRGLMIAAAAGLVFIAGQARGLLGGLPPRAGLARGRGAGADLSRDPHLGGAGDDRDLRADRLADRDGADARRAGAAAGDERAQRRARASPSCSASAGGCAGVAAATLIAEWSGLALGLWLCRAAFAGDQWRDWARVFDPARLRRMAAVNGDILIRSVVLQASFTSFLFFGAGLGDVTLAANQVLLQFLSITAYALDGFAFAAEALVGQTLGRPRPRRRCGGRRSSTSEWGVGSSLAAGAGLRRRRAVRSIDLMATAPEVRAEARAYLPWIAAAPLVGIAAWMLDGIFIGATETRAMRNAAMLSRSRSTPRRWRSCCRRFGNHGLWAALMVLNAHARHHARAALSGARGAGGLSPGWRSRARTESRGGRARKAPHTVAG